MSSSSLLRKLHIATDLEVEIGTQSSTAVFSFMVCLCPQQRIAKEVVIGLFVGFVVVKSNPITGTERRAFLFQKHRNDAVFFVTIRLSSDLINTITQCLNYLYRNRLFLESKDRTHTQTTKVSLVFLILAK
jgi:hypothetical protein